MKHHILVVEDDLDLHFILCKMLKSQNYHIQSAYSGEAAKQLILQNEYDLIILDLMLPEVTGEELLILIRQKQIVPVMIISSKAHIEDRVAALENGADDYLTKPFSQQEVLARVGALIRRYKKFNQQKSNQRYLDFKNLSVDTQIRSCRVKNKALILTNKEFDLLCLFLQQPEKVFTKAFLYEQIWGDTYVVEDNALNVHISHLRKKLKAFDEETAYIETVWGIGFKLKNDA